MRDVDKTPDAAALRLRLARLHQRAREQKGHLPQYAGAWDGWGLGKVVSDEGLRANAPSVGELVLIEPGSPAQAFRGVYSVETRSQWLMPAATVAVIFEPTGVAERDPETTDVRNLTYPPDDLPSEPAVIRSDGALRRWNGYLWRWSWSSGWHYVGPL